MEVVRGPTPDELQILRDWIKQTPHVPQDYDDQFLSCFFRASKGRLQRTKLVLENFCNLGVKHPEMYSGWDIKRANMLEFLEAAYFFPIPKKADNDAGVLVSALCEEPTDPMKHHVLEVFRLQLMYMLFTIREKTFGSGKIILIADCKGLTLKHMRDLTPGMLAAWVTALEKSLPVRIQGIHAVNVPTVVEWVFSLIKKLAKQKISQRIFVHSQVTGLIMYLSKDVLPEEYGGTLGPSKLLFENWKQTLKENRDYFTREEAKIRELDAVRPKFTSDDATETFKKLSVD